VHQELVVVVGQLHRNLGLVQLEQQEHILGQLGQHMGLVVVGRKVEVVEEVVGVGVEHTHMAVEVEVRMSTSLTYGLRI